MLSTAKFYFVLFFKMAQLSGGMKEGRGRKKTALGVCSYNGRY